jgi:hypothetical protein
MAAGHITYRKKVESVDPKSVSGTSKGVEVHIAPVHGTLPGDPK